MEKIQGALACTDWSVFSDTITDINELTDTISEYIKFCESVCVETKNVKIFPNNKPWITKELKIHLNEKQTLIKSGDKEALKEKQAVLNSEITKSKDAYKDKIKNAFQSQNSRQAWDGLRKASGFHQDKPTLNIPNQNTFVEELNEFYCRFDAVDYSDQHKDIKSRLSNYETSIVITESVVKTAFKKLNCRKASGPDCVSARVLRFCADELTPIYCHLFNRSVSEKTVPTIWKTSEIVPIPKKNKPAVLNDYRPIALTSIAMKCLEKLVLKHILSHCEPCLDDYQFAYTKERSTEDAVLVLLDRVLKHLDQPNTYARALFIDYSSAFNTIQPHHMINKLLALSVPQDQCLWVLDFLTDRKQYVKIGNCRSSVRVLNTGAPQGCGLSPFLFIIYTNDFCASQAGCLILKYADDTVVLV